MNKNNAKDYFPLVQALAEGKTVQQNLGYINSISWSDVSELDTSYPASHFRIKPEPKKGWYRVALFKPQLGCYPITTVVSEQAELEVVNDPHFRRWLTDRIEYELPE